MKHLKLFEAFGEELDPKILKELEGKMKELLGQLKHVDANVTPHKKYSGSSWRGDYLKWIISEPGHYGRSTQDGYKWTEGDEDDHNEREYDGHGFVVGSLPDHVEDGWEDPRAKAWLEDQEILSKFNQKYKGKYNAEMDGVKYVLGISITIPKEK